MIFFSKNKIFIKKLVKGLIKGLSNLTRMKRDKILKPYFIGYYIYMIYKCINIIKKI